MSLRSKFVYTLAAAAAGTLVSAGAALADKPFDGQWSVQIVAENGSCSDHYTIPVQVQEGRVVYSGKYEARAKGLIRENGTLNVSFSHDKDVLVAKGRLDGNKGLGSWKSPTKGCDGTWTARRG